MEDSVSLIFEIVGYGTCARHAGEILLYREPRQVAQR